MDNSIDRLNNKTRKNWEIIQKTHQALLSINENIKFRIFPIYIQYYDIEDDSLIAVMYFNGNQLVNNEHIKLGLNLKKQPVIKELQDASGMNYANINYCCSLDNSTKNIILLSNIIESFKH